MSNALDDTYPSFESLERQERQMSIALLSMMISMIIVFSLALLVAGTKIAFAASLKDVAIIEGESLTAGDLFDGLDDKSAAFVLGPAPLPGKDMVLNARTLYRVATTLDISWRPAHTAEQIVVRRSATLVGNDVVKDALKNALREKGVSGNFAVDIHSGARNFILPARMDATADIEDLRYDPDKGTFEAKVVAPSSATPLKSRHVTGAIETLVMVPVLATSLRNGDLIGENDLDMIEMRASELAQDMVIDADKIVGATPRKLIVAGKPVRDHDIQAPELVKRGEPVTLILQYGTMTLTAEGRALQNGAEGDLVKVVNTGSNQTIKGEVSGSREVVVDMNS